MTRNDRNEELSALLVATGERLAPGLAEHLAADRASSAPSDDAAAMGEPSGVAPSIDLHDDDRTRALVRGRRVALVARTAARSDVLAQELRAAGALVAVCDGAGEGIEHARQLAPQIVIVDGTGVGDWARADVDLFRRDLVLRWAPMLVIDWDELWGDCIPDIERLALAIDLFVTAERALVERALREERVTTQLDELGPVRLLHALADTRLGLRVTLRHPDGVVEVDLLDGILACARATSDRPEESPAQGTAALLVMLELAGGEVTIERVDAPRSTELMAPLDAAMSAVLCEVPVVFAATTPTRPAPPSPEAVRRSRPRVQAPPERPRSPTRSVLEELCELPSILNDHDEAETGRFAPEILDQLRRRSRRSSDRGIVAGGSAARPAPHRREPMPSGSAPPACGVDATPPPPWTTAPTPFAPLPCIPPEAAPPRPSSDPCPSEPPQLAVAAPSRRTSLLVLVAVLAMLGVTAVGASLDATTLSEPPPPPAGEAAVSSSSQEPAGEAAVSVAAAPEEPRSLRVESVLGPGPAEALEGSDADLDWARFGVVQAPARPRAGSRNLDGLVRRANGARARGDLERAADLYRAVLAVDRENARATAGLARVHQARRDAAGAILLGQRLVRLRRHPNNYVLLGDMLLLGGNRAAARRAFERALEIDRRCARAHRRLAAFASDRAQ